MKDLSIGIASGSLQESTIGILNRMGLQIIINGKNFSVEIKGSDLFSKAIIMRPNDLPLALKSGIVDAILTGFDMLAESGLQEDLIVMKKLNFSKSRRSPARVVVFCRQNDIDEIIDSEEVHVSSEYINLAKSIFKKAKMIFSSGSTEIKASDARFGFRYGVGVVDSGRSLSDNKLKIVRVIMDSPVVFVVREKTEDFEIFGEMLYGVLSAENFQLVKFNASSESLENIMTILPALQSPTISHLANGAVAIETVVPKDKLTDVTIEIKKRGGTGIIIQDINVAV